LEIIGLVASMKFALAMPYEEASFKANLKPELKGLFTT